MAPAVLLSRTLDPALGVFTGVFAFYLYETHPRTALPSEERLETLIRWKWSIFQKNRATRLDKIGEVDRVSQPPKLR
ncbi:hypothetical protein BDZ94DRAFT_1216083 [Collybia nuda]|uniref:Uncharacterized protein n=1 Tax=Collybia nuda TaxID=64659 RepID=A0A9P5YAE1_9AGAR|nr:hypothetical protein BDZ94DRAFT_1216083 [Collybia nuda]